MREFDYFTPSTAELNPCGCGRRTYWKGGK